ncbi:thiamine-phosphate diphosphorylase [Anaerobacterium chartisolvens]|uniref:Thiamine-phosphate synthase n=1 Tax=Anaerobacterium chartisolvens TaxID=1297424 RepID=A0A369BFT8_9FIRM|nr:thiamine phosphate synthase [Anaerobacterium chartisolvens]RCX20125.1 thiamine-phosphate diphosphorylase [Anaerobacterium chartisolvens]
MSDKLFRLIDANINRASEGLRVAEDITRFYFDNRELSEKLKKLRHDIRKGIMPYMNQCLDGRRAEEDVGLSVSRELKIDQKSRVDELVAANFKRAEEALRVVEESLKPLCKYDMAKDYEGFRFSCYGLEKQCALLVCGRSRRQKLGAGLYCLTAEEFSKGRSNIQVVQEMINAGVKIIQYREKEKKLADKFSQCVKLRELTRREGVTFIINDNIDMAMMVGADGVHIGQDDLPIEKVRELVGQEMIIGLSTHSPAQAQDAVARGADYIGVGPIYKTFTKKDVCDPVGLEYLQYAVDNIDIPFVAIGGIKESNMHEVVSRGAKCIAMVTEIVGAENIEQKIRSINNKMGECITR